MIKDGVVMSRDIMLLHPELQEIIPKFLEKCKQQGLIVKTTDTLRNKKEQDELYAQGRTKPGNIVTWVKYPYSNHNWGIAFDISRNDGKGDYNNSDGWFDKVGQIAKSFGLEWGGDWQIQDKPHFQLTKYGTTNQLVAKYGNFENFKKTWQSLKEDNYMLVERNYEYNDKIKSYIVINENGENYIRIKDLAELLNKNLTYNNDSKITILEDIIEEKPIIVNDKETIVKCVNYKGYNYMNARDLGDALGYEVGYNETLHKVFFKIKKSIVEKLKLLFK